MSLHLGVNEELGLIRLSRSKTTHAALAAYTAPFSAYLIAFPIWCDSPLKSVAWAVLAPRLGSGWFWSFARPESEIAGSIVIGQGGQLKGVAANGEFGE